MKNPLLKYFSSFLILIFFLLFHLNGSAQTWSSITNKPTIFSGLDINVLIRQDRTTTNVNFFITSGFYGLDASNLNNPPFGYQALLSVNNMDVGYQLAGGYVSDNLYFRGYYYSGTAFTPWRTVLHSGNVGTYALPLSGGTLTGSFNGTSAYFSDHINVNSYVSVNNEFIVGTTYLGSANLYNYASGGNLNIQANGGKVFMGRYSDNRENFAIDDLTGNARLFGSFHIGTVDPNKVSNYALAVNGSAIFTKATVQSYSSWPDYVFEKNYLLPKLSDLESFINTNHHLPEIPTAKEVEKDGIDLGSNQTLLLKKIEELTLLLLKVNKKVDDQSKRIKNLEYKQE